MRWKFAICLIVGTLVSGSAWADEYDNKMCAGLKAQAAAQNARGPVWIDSATKREKTEVDCVEKIVIWTQTFTIDFKPGFADALQAMVNKDYCDNPAQSENIRHGWGVAFLDIFPDGNKVWVKAKCR